MKIKKLLCAALAAVAVVPTVSAFAMSTAEFDNGMRNGINYFNRGLYYEARDEFQWFCDYNWGKMNSGQQKYALDYLGAAKQKVAKWESGIVTNPDFTNLVGMTCEDITKKYGYMYKAYGFEGGSYYKHGNCPYAFVYGFNYDYPQKWDTCKLVSGRLSDLIPNAKWSYTKSELENLFGVNLDGQPWTMADDDSTGYSFDYKGLHIDIYTYAENIQSFNANGHTIYRAIWNGTVYADFDVEVSHYDGQGQGHVG